MEYERVPESKQQQEETRSGDGQTNNNDSRPKPFHLISTTSAFSETEEANALPPPTENTRLALFALCMANACDGVETMAFGSVLTGFVNPSTGQRLDAEPALSAMLTTSVFIGMLVGGLIAGRLADNFGRKPILLCCLALNALCGLFSFFSPFLPRQVMRQVFWLFFFRLIGGLGIGGSIPCCYALAAELTGGDDAQLRGRRVTILGTAWTLGSIFVALSAWFILDPRDNTQSWPWFFLWCSSVAWASLALTHWYVHEQPRQSTAVEVEEMALPAASFPRHRIVVCFCLVWFSQNFGSYGPLIWTGSVFNAIGFEDPYLIALLAASFALVGNFTALVTMDYLSHKHLLVAGMLLSASAALTFGLPAAPTWLLVSSACLFTSSVGLSWISLGVVSAEAFPKEVRATLFGAASSFGRLGSIAANAINPLLLQDGLILPIAGLVLLLGALLVVTSMRW